MRTLTARKMFETEKAAQYLISFWMVEHPDQLPGQILSDTYYVNMWFPKKIVTAIDDTHIGIPKKFLEDTLEIIACKHIFDQARYNARHFPDRFRWTVEAIQEKL